MNKIFFIKQNLKGIAWLLPLIFMAIIFIVVPFFSGMIDAFKVTETFDRINFEFGTKNFTQLFNSFEFKNAFYYSNMILIIGGSLGIILSIGFALLLNSILNKIFKNIVVTILFSQFFISSFAIGLAFIYLFDVEKSLFNLIFQTNFEFTEGNNNLIVLITFHIWRIWPFSTVILLFHFTSQKKKYYYALKIDNLSWTDQLKNIYFQKIHKIFFSIIYINILEALLLNPLAIYSENTLLVNNVTTFSYYIYYYLIIISEPNFGIAAAASIICLLYLILIAICLIIIYFSIVYWPKIKKLLFKKSNILWKKSLE